MPEAITRAGWWLWSLNPLALLLWPLSWLFCGIVRLRRTLYRRGMLASSRLDRPVIVVGNISVGGNGKTPVVHVLVRLLRERGYHPGILTRGYKSDHEGEVLVLDQSDGDVRAGDEANMLAELCACPIAVSADRVSAGRTLLQRHPEIDVLIADDGLQHYALERDIEIIVNRIQAQGNGLCLPAGPLREPLSRLQQCDLLIQRDSDDLDESLGVCWNLANPEHKRDLSSFCDHPVHALAGIGFPDLFFAALAKRGLDVTRHAFPDHHEFTRRDLPGGDDAPLLVTHKDAVKLRSIAGPNTWVVPLVLTLSDALQYRFFKLLESRLHG